MLLQSTHLFWSRSINRLFQLKVNVHECSCSLGTPFLAYVLGLFRCRSESDESRENNSLLMYICRWMQKYSGSGSTRSLTNKPSIYLGYRLRHEGTCFTFWEASQMIWGWKNPISVIEYQLTSKNVQGAAANPANTATKFQSYSPFVVKFRFQVPGRVPCR
jgi:hypothetical protein